MVSVTTAYKIYIKKQRQQKTHLIRPQLPSAPETLFLLINIMLSFKLSVSYFTSPLPKLSSFSPFHLSTAYLDFYTALFVLFSDSQVRTQITMQKQNVCVCVCVCVCVFVLVLGEKKKEGKE